MLYLWVITLPVCPKVLYLSQDPLLPAITKGASTWIYIFSVVILCRKVLPELH